MELLDKLSVLSDAAKYDAACTSSGAKRGFEHGKIGCTSSGVMGCCHSFSADGRCITLLKVLLSNDCMYDCKYCVNRRTNETRRATFTPNKTKAAVLRPMRFIADRGQENRRELVKYRHVPRFAPAGQATQMIVGATGESDRHILTLTQSLYDTYHLKRVFYSAYVPVVENTLLPSLDTKPPLLREHRLYQADWLLRFYGFRAGELLDEGQPDFDPLLDPKCCWALRHPDFFPVEVNRADYEALLRVPGIGVVSAKRILVARRGGALRAEDLKKLGVVLKRAQYFLTCSGRSTAPLRLSLEGVRRNLTATERASLPAGPLDQLSLFEPA